MPRYFFNRTNGVPDRDEDGVELDDIEAAKVEAVMLAGAIVRDDPKNVWDGHDCRVDVTNEAGTLLFAIVVQAIEAPVTIQSRYTGILPTEES